MTSVKKTLAVDWDGTFVHYEKYNGPGNFGAVIPGMLARVKKWISEGHEVIVFTSRVSLEWREDVVMAEVDAIQKELKRLGLPRLQITANKYSRITEFWDDRGVRVERNAGFALNEPE